MNKLIFLWEEKEKKIFQSKNVTLFACRKSLQKEGQFFFCWFTQDKIYFNLSHHQFNYYWFSLWVNLRMVFLSLCNFFPSCSKILYIREEEEEEEDGKWKRREIFSWWTFDKFNIWSYQSLKQASFGVNLWRTKFLNRLSTTNADVIVI